MNAVTNDCTVTMSIANTAIIPKMPLFWMMSIVPAARIKKNRQPLRKVNTVIKMCLILMREL